ncbi:MAG: hypothetical protein OXC31_27695 [Spirochaetaceae bacterium]|nr:hypothetical protein [Spirochaetaceae bacterium]
MQTIIGRCPTGRESMHQRHHGAQVQRSHAGGTLFFTRPRPQNAAHASLKHTVAALKPRLLILDPFVRLHRVDENPVAKSPRCSPICANCNAAINSPSWSCITPGRPPIACATAKRCAAHRSFTPRGTATCICAVSTTRSPSPSSTAPAPIPLILRADDDTVALDVRDRPPPLTSASPSLDERIATALAAACPGALSVAALRSRCRVRNATLYRRLAALCSQGVLVTSTAGYRLADEPDASLPALSTPPGNGTRSSTD